MVVWSLDIDCGCRIIHAVVACEASENSHHSISWKIFSHLQTWQILQLWNTGANVTERIVKDDLTDFSQLLGDGTVQESISHTDICRHRLFHKVNKWSWMANVFSYKFWRGYLGETDSSCNLMSWGKRLSLAFWCTLWSLFCWRIIHPQALYILTPLK